MRLVFQRLRPGETDWEAIWGGVLGVGLIAGALWMRIGLPLPKCVIFGLTGIPCLSCGGTRTARALLAGDPMTAIQTNPLVAVGLLAAGVFTMYAAVVVLARLPRLRITDVSASTKRALRIVIPVCLAAAWIYLIATLARPPGAV